MKRNMAGADRILRIIISVVFAVLYFTQTVTGTAGLVLLVLAAIFTLTSIVGFCPLYKVFGLKTGGDQQA